MAIEGRIEYRFKKEDPLAVQNAVLNASEVPLRTAQLALQSLEQLKIVAEKGNINAATDAAAGAHMALAAIEAAALNVLVNLQDLANETVANDLRAQITAVRETGRQLAEEVLAVVKERTGLA